MREPPEGHSREPSHEVYTIRDLQKEIAHDEVSDNGGVTKDFVNHFRLLLLSGQFERAVFYLHQTECDVEAVHFAIALAYYGLLRVPETQDAVSLCE